MIKKLIAALVALLMPALASAQWVHANRAVDRTTAGVSSMFDRMHIRNCIRNQGRGNYTDIKCQYGAEEADRMFRKGRYANSRPGEGIYPRIGYAGRTYRGPQYMDNGYGDPYDIGYAGEYGDPYGYPGSYGYGGYGSYGGLGIELNGRTLGTVAGGVAGGVLFRKKGPGTQAAGIVGGAILGNILGGKVDDARYRRNYRREVERMAQRPSRPAPQVTEPEDSEASAVPEPRLRRLCNRTDHPIIVYKDGRELGELAPGWYTDIEPGGKLDVRSESCELQGQEAGDDVNLSCQKEN